MYVSSTSSALSPSLSPSLVPRTRPACRYFRGILFLTTNRVRVFDEAFQSRIHVSLRYADLSSDARRQIWLAFLKRVNGAEAPHGGLSYDDLHTLAEKKVNGRQIKNIVKTAGALALGRQERLGFAHLEQVLDLMEQFDTAYVCFLFLPAAAPEYRVLCGGGSGPFYIYLLAWREADASVPTPTGISCINRRSLLVFSCPTLFCPLFRTTSSERIFPSEYSVYDSSLVLYSSILGPPHE